MIKKYNKICKPINSIMIDNYFITVACICAVLLCGVVIVLRLLYKESSQIKIPPEYQSSTDPLQKGDCVKFIRQYDDMLTHFGVGEIAWVVDVNGDKVTVCETKIEEISDAFGDKVAIVPVDYLWKVDTDTVE